MNKKLKWTGGILLVVILFLAFSVWVAIKNPLLNEDNYIVQTYSPIGLELFIPKDCVMESEQTHGFQCKSSVYTYDKGQKEGYLITVAALEVRPVVLMGTRGTPDKELTGQEAWEYSLGMGACSISLCTKKTIQGYPAVSTSLFSTEEKISSFNSENTYIFKDGIQYALSVRAADQSDAKQILHLMEKKLSWKEVATP